MKKLVFVCFSALLFSAVANAGILIEPFVGYSTGSGKASGNASGISYSTTDTENGAIFGARAGYSFALLSFGAEYEGGSLAANSKVNISGVQTTVTGTSTMTNLGAFAEINLPIIDGYVGYFPSAQATSSGTTNSGSAFQIGIGYKMLPLINVNLEYLNSSYNKTNDSSTTGYSASGSLYILSVSLPINI